MIELSPNTALMLYLGFTLLVLFGIWGASHYKRRTRTFLPMEKELVVCEFCLFAYIDDGAKQVTRCPRCESFNKAKPAKRD